jgi:hypothetical protein
VIAINPPGISGLGYTPGSQIVFSVNVTQPAVNASSFQGFTIGIAYNKTIMQAQSIDYSGTVLGSSPNVPQECINGTSIVPGGICTILNEGGVELTLLRLGTPTTPPTNGVLFKVTFKVNATGYSQLHLVRAALSAESNAGIGIQLPARSVDGYFVNIDCPRGTGTLCKPPMPIFDFSPARPVINSGVTFNATKSWSPNKILSGKNASIVDYSWDFGSGSGESPTPIISHAYFFASQFTVTLTVTDSDGAIASFSILINVIRVWLDLAIGPGEFTADNSAGVQEGTLINVTAHFHNFSTQNENATVEIRLENSLLARRTYLNVSADGSGVLSQLWNTAGDPPRAYKLVAIVDPIINATTGQLIENDTTNNQQAVFVQVVEPLPGGAGLFLGLSMTATFGVGIFLLAAIGAGVRLFTRGANRRPRS